MTAKILQLDIETFPHRVYAWGLWAQDIAISQIIEAGYTACWAAKWYGKRGIMFASIKEDGAEKMLKKMYDLLESADMVVHYNGTKFDMPTLNKEFLMMGWPPPSNYREIDLLKTARSRFRLASNKLDYVATVLGHGGKVKHKGMELWTDCMNGCPKAWRHMKKYNKQDVLLLEKVYDDLKPWIKNHPNVALYIDSEAPLCRMCGSDEVVKNGVEHTNGGSYQRYRCQGCGAPLRARSNMNSQKAKVLV